MKKLRRGQKVRFSATNDFTGDEMKCKGKVIGDYRKIRETWLKRPIPETISKSELESELEPARRNASGVGTYYRFKALDWAKVLVQLAPVLTAFLAYITKKKEN
jgi:hypothetical protein